MVTYGKHTTEFKLQVVKAILDEGLSFLEAAKRFGFTSHSNVKNWVKAYRTLGEEGLHDGRGKGQKKVRAKVPAGLTIEQENAWLRAQNEYLKKLLKLERRDVRNKKNTLLFKS